LGDVFRGGMSFRRLGVLVAGLPPESATASAIGYDAPPEVQATGRERHWSLDQHLLASVLDGINQLVWVTVAKDAKRRPKPPKPVSRPGSRVRVVRMPADKRKRLEAQIERPS
jgi:hypothetical protein